MTDFARVTSIESLRRFRAALIDFAESAGLALSEAQSDVQRTIGWLQNDRLAHWQRQLKKRNEKLALAKSELFRKQLESSDMRTSAVVERKNVAKMQALVDEAETKIRAVKKWKQVLEREFILFKAQCSHVSGIVSADIPMTVGRMDKMISSLEAYVSLAAPSGRSLNAPVANVAIENVFTEPLPSESVAASRDIGSDEPSGPPEGADAT